MIVLTTKLSRLPVPQSPSVTTNGRPRLNTDCLPNSKSHNPSLKHWFHLHLWVMITHTAVTHSQPYINHTHSTLCAKSCFTVVCISERFVRKLSCPCLRPLLLFSLWLSAACLLTFCLFSGIRVVCCLPLTSCLAPFYALFALLHCLHWYWTLACWLWLINCCKWIWLSLMSHNINSETMGILVCGWSNVPMIFHNKLVFWTNASANARLL